LKGTWQTPRAGDLPAGPTVGFSRNVVRPNSLAGKDEALQYSGQELAFLFSTPDGDESCFIETASWWDSRKP
jgi:hypothetical protein